MPATSPSFLSHAAIPMPGGTRHVPDVPGSSLWKALVDLVFAPVCLGCDGSISAGDDARIVCRRCRSLLRPLPAPACERCGAPLLRTGRARDEPCAECRAWPPGLLYARSACLLAPPADRLVHKLKYRGWPALAEPMAERMTALLLPADLRNEASIVVPVPTTPARQRERGYNQAELLARAFARQTRRQVRILLRRSAARTTQTALQPAARGANVAGAFAVVADGAGTWRGEHLILVDDVLTTGATAVECARTLLAAGARAVSVVTFARALDARRLTGT